MLWPPSLLRVRIHEHGTKKVSLWLPLLLLWPLALALGVALAPVAILVAACCWRQGYGKTILYGGPRIFRIFCSLRGLEVNVQEPNEHVCIKIW